MSRRIVTTQYHAAIEQDVDGYLDRLVKYIPAEIVAAWVAAAGIIASLQGDTEVVLWIAFAIGVVVSFLWIILRTQEAQLSPAWTQAGIAAVAFVIWAFALGGPFATFSWYEPAYGSLLIIRFTLLAGLVIPKE